MTRNRDLPIEMQGKVKLWQFRLNNVLVSCLVSCVIFLGEKLLIQIISVGYHRRQFAHRIQVNKENLRILSQLYEVSRNLFPEYTEFAEEDYLIRQGYAGALELPGMRKKNGVATPMRHIIGNINIVHDKVTSAFGNIAQEVTGNKNVFNPNSAYAIVVEALHRKSSAEALAQRIWMSLVAEGCSSLTLADLKDVLSPGFEGQAEEFFESLDRDDNGDVSLEEMILHVLHSRNERFDVAKSMQDVVSLQSATCSRFNITT
jgi:hypothetical protein